MDGEVETYINGRSFSSCVAWHSSFELCSILARRTVSHQRNTSRLAVLQRKDDSVAAK